MVGRLIDLGCATISLGDTIGVATAGQVAMLCAAVADSGVAPDRIALHFHDTYGQALANVVAGLQAGVSEFDASAGGLGGCPFAKSATGNLATEDLVWLLTGLGYRPRHRSGRPGRHQSMAGRATGTAGAVPGGGRPGSLRVWVAEHGWVAGLGAGGGSLRGWVAERLGR